MNQNVENSDKFRKAMADKEMTRGDLVVAISRYVEKEVEFPSQRISARANLMRELGKSSMTDKVLAKGMAIINMHPQ